MKIVKTAHNLLTIIIVLACVYTSSCKKIDKTPPSKPQFNSAPTKLIEIEIRRAPGATQLETHRLIAKYTTVKNESCGRYGGISLGTNYPSIEVPLEQKSPLHFTAQLDLVLPGDCGWHLDSIRDPIWINNRPHAILYLKEEDLGRRSNRYKCYDSKNHGMECVNLDRTTIKWDTTHSPIELEYLIQQK